MACVLVIALVKAKKAVAFAQKQIDWVHEDDVAIIDKPFEQPWVIAGRIAIDGGHQIDDSEGFSLQCEDA